MFGKTKLLKPLAQDSLDRIVKRAIEDARNYVAEDIAPDRALADRYYRGHTSVKSARGRSQIVVTRVRDAVKSVIPSLARVFTQSDTIAEFTSEMEADEKICVQQSLFVNQVYNKFGGYTALIQACTDALKAKVGVVKVTLEQNPVAVHTFEDLVNPEQLRMLETDETQQITEMTPPMPAPEGDGEVYGVVLTKQSFRNKWHLDPVPPESFFISRGATRVDDARIIGTAENLEAWEAMEKLGLSLEDLLNADRDPDLDTEAQLRSGVDPEADLDNGDPMSREVLVCEAWMRLDADGDGVPELRHLITVGTGYRIVLDEPANFVPLAVFKAELQPHTFFPICLAEDLEQDQDAQTALLRSIIDNTAAVNAPRTAVVEAQVNLEDVINPEIGAIVRTKAPGMIEELVTPFVAGQTLPVLQYLESVAEARSGVTKMSQGLSADALQSSPKEAAAAMVQGSDARIEMMARNLAETGVTEMFLCILRTAMYEMRGPQSVRTQAGYEEVRPDLWHDQVTINVNVGLGNGRVGEKAMVLAELAQVQQQIMGMLGLDNKLAGWEQLRKTFVDKAKLAGIRNIQDYLPLVPEQELTQIAQQMQQGQQPPPDPNAGLVEAEKIKAQAQMQIKSAEIQQRGQIEQAKLETQLASDMIKARMEDDRARDLADAEFAVKAQQAQLDAAVKADVAAKQAAQRSYPASHFAPSQAQQPQPMPPGGMPQ
jgi:hypothetical protein